MWQGSVRRTSGAARARSVRRWNRLYPISLVVVILGMTLAGCSSSSNQTAAQHEKAKLDQQLSYARNTLGIPQSMLQPIAKQEAKIAKGEGGWNYDYTAAEHNYTLLYNQLVGVEQTSADTLNKQTQADLQAFAAVLAQRTQQGFIEANAYQARYNQAEQDLTAAKVPGDFVKIDTTVRQQTEALQAMWPAYQKLDAYKTVLQALVSTGVNTTTAQSQYNADLQTFRDAASAARYGTLANVIDAQMMQLMADQTEAMPYIGASLLSSFEARIGLLKQYGVDTTSYQQQYTSDKSALSTAHTLADYQSLAQSINKDVGALALPLAKGEAQSDLASYKSLVAQGNQIQVVNKFDGSKWPAAYEYTNGPQTNSLDDVVNTLNAAQTVSSYQAIDLEIKQLTYCLRAEIDNMSATTAHDQPHATDLQILQSPLFGIGTGKAIIVSLREQTLRAYDNGKLVFWSYVTTGRPELPSPPGYHTAMFKEAHIMFTSAEPKGSPFWYAPTPINYAMLYANYGFFVHDAWWRSEFGPSTNLPHYDPAAFDGGSHGCVNLPLDNMQWLYNWTPQGTPIILY